MDDHRFDTFTRVLTVGASSRRRLLTGALRLTRGMSPEIADALQRLTGTRPTVFAYPYGFTTYAEAVPVIAMVLVPALLMVTTIRFRSFKTIDLQARRPYTVLLVIAAGIMLIVQKVPGANTLEVTDGVEEAMDEMKPGLPGIQVHDGLFRPATFIEQSIDNLTWALLLGVLLVAVVAAGLYAPSDRRIESQLVGQPHLWSSCRGRRSDQCTPGNDSGQRSSPRSPAAQAGPSGAPSDAVS